MAVEIPNLINALGSVSAVGAKVSGAGFSVASSGAGEYQITLEQGVDAAQCAIVVTPRGAALAADVGYTVEHTSDTVKTVHFTDAGVATNHAFDFAVMNCPQQG